MSLAVNQFLTPSRLEIEGAPNADNTFELMPVTQAGSTKAGYSLAVNVATYSGSDIHEPTFDRTVGLGIRWQQGLNLEVDEIEPIDSLVYGQDWQEIQESRKRGLPHLPADHAFAGRVALKPMGLVVPVYGVMHPRVSGWIKLDMVGQESPEPMRTVADLKAKLGNISARAAEGFDRHFAAHGTFAVRSLVLK
jgi:hypothetical protein